MNFSKFLALLVVCAVFLSANVVFASDVSDFNATDAGINDHIGAVPVSKDVIRIVILLMFLHLVILRRLWVMRIVCMLNMEIMFLI